ncbi:MAG: tetratricopeptide repeat-containing protein [Burkholderiales bacterium]
MRAFIVRPFGTKSEIDFDRVDRELIGPALAAAGIAGGTTAEFVEAGNIRADMFEQLLKANVVIADISIHNANVFYELGIRHALRDRFTILISCAKDDVPFDLKTDRYFQYAAANPAATLATLVEALQRTVGNTKADSPVFSLIPGLAAQDWEKYIVVPEDFAEEVKLAARAKHVGDLEMLATEAYGFEWELEGLRQVGKALFALKAWSSARGIWEVVRTLNDDDADAAVQLPTIYQRLGDLAKSEIALERGLKYFVDDSSKRAELFALQGSNEKTLWVREWKAVPSDDQRRTALVSAHLALSIEAYEDGFREDLNHFYSGLNALSLLQSTVELAGALPDAWSSGFDDEGEAATRLAELKQHLALLSGTVRYSIERTRERLKTRDKRDVWTDVSWADYRCLTATRPDSVGRAYRDALTGASDFNFDAVRRQLQMLDALSVKSENVKAALKEIDALDKASNGLTKIEPIVRVLVFTGHMIDAPDRKTPRFPAAKEQAARRAIRDAILSEQQKYPGRIIGIAGGACGGDILFHEACAETGIATELLLALPRDAFVRESVQHGGPQWVERFEKLSAARTPRVLVEREALPRWLRMRKGYSVWERNNLWTLFNALAHGGEKVTLIALWDGQSGDGPGGTQDMVDKAKARGAVVQILDTHALVGA